MRKKFGTLIRITLLVMTLLAIVAPAAFGIGMLLVSVLFCDVGPVEKCTHIGVAIMTGCLACAALPVPAAITLVRYKKPLNRYMYVYPLLMLALAVVAHEKELAALGLKSIVYDYGCLALVAFVYVIFHRINARREMAAVAIHKPPPTL